MQTKSLASHCLEGHQIDGRCTICDISLHKHYQGKNFVESHKTLHFDDLLQIVLLQETAIDNDQHAKIKCQRMISDTDHAAELEAKTHGIHSIFFLEHFAHQWLNHALALAAFVGLDVDSLHTKAAIKHRPDGLISYKRKMNTSPWLSLVDKCQAYT